MTPEDLEQIRQIVREEIAPRIERAMTAVADEFTELRAELARKFAGIDRRLEAVERRLDNLAPVIISAQAQMAAFTRSVDQLIGAHHETQSTQAAQQLAIDQLTARVTRLEKELRPEQ